MEMDYINYTIQPTDSIRSIADRFGVSLDELVKLNPQVCTPGKQEGIEIKIPKVKDDA
jgi:LysM repeat protein